MKRLIVLVLPLLLVALLSCNTIDPFGYLDKEEVLTFQKKYSQAQSELKLQILYLENQLDDVNVINERNTENLVDYNRLLSNLNQLLLNVFYVYDHKGSQQVWGTGFTMEHNSQIYFITAGHLVKGNQGDHPRLIFKQNFTNNCYYPKLLYYDHQTGSDFAVFECRLINYGFVPQKENSIGYILGNLTLNYNIIKSELETARRGESGSPVVNLKGEVTALRTTTHSNTDIDKVLEALDSL